MKLKPLSLALLCTASAVCLLGCNDDSDDLAAIGGQVSGLGSNLSVVLQDNQSDTVTVSANGGFVLPAQLSPGSAYNVTVLTQPAGQFCQVTGGMGLVDEDGDDVNDIVVSCVNTATIGGTLAGMTPGSSVTLQDNGGDNLTLTANGSFTFATALMPGATYAVTLLTQPPGQTCMVGSGGGSVDASGDDVNSVSVACAASATVGVMVSGLLPGTVLTLQNNGGDNLVIFDNGSFNFATGVVAAAPYNVTVLNQPAGQTCQVAQGSGMVDANADPVNSVIVTCTATN